MSQTAAEWYQANAPGVEPLSEGNRRCLNVLLAIDQLHNLACPRPIKWGIYVTPNMVSVLLQSQMATFDDERLTRLVIAAHRECVRVSVGPYVPWVDDDDRHRAILVWANQDNDGDRPRDVWPIPPLMEVTLHARQSRIGSTWQRHPGMERFSTTRET